MLDRFKNAVRRWLGVDTDLAMLKSRIDRDLIALGLEFKALQVLESEDRNNLQDCANVLTEYATTLNRLAGVVHGYGHVIKRWSEESETLRAIEARAKRKAEGSKILSLPASGIVNGN